MKDIITEEPQQIHAGYYGKIPARGDFVKHQLPRSFIEPWDDWLQTAIHRSKEQLAENWLDAYLTSPIYRFLLSSGLCGSRQWMGVFMPSVDRVGRYFPMILCMPVPSTENIFSLLKSSENWFIEAERLISSCLEDEFDLDEFNQSVAGMSITVASDVDYDFTRQTASGSKQVLIRQALDSMDEVNRAFPDILDTILHQFCFAYSLWWTQGSERLTSSLLISQGLPAVDSFQALFSGDWKNQGWLDNKDLTDPDITHVRY